MKSRIKMKMALLIVLGILSGCNSSICSQPEQEPKDRIAKLYDLEKSNFVEKVILSGEMDRREYRYSRCVGSFWMLTLTTLSNGNSFIILDDNDSDEVGDDKYDECTLVTEDSEKTYNEGTMLRWANEIADLWVPKILKKHRIQVVCTNH